MISNIQTSFLKEAQLLIIEPRLLTETLHIVTYRPAHASHNVISALGACIACTTLALIVVTAYMGFSVYIQGKKQLNLNKNQ